MYVNPNTRFPAHVLILVTLAILAAMPTAVVGNEPVQAISLDGRNFGRIATGVVPADGHSTGGTTGPADLGGAIFSPFAQIREKSVAAANDRKGDEPDLTATLAVALASLAILAVALLRAHK